MIITREVLKSEIDRVRQEHLSVLFKIIKALEEPVLRAGIQGGASRWKQFIAEAYSSLAEAPIERGEQWEPEHRAPFE